MKDLVIKYPLLWLIGVSIPICSIVGIIGSPIGLSDLQILTIQIPALLFQLFSLFIMIRYRKELFDIEY